MVRMSRKAAIFDGLFTKEDIVNAFHVDDEYNIEDEVSEATVMEIDNIQNECMREMEDDLNRILLQNHKDVNKGCYLKKRVLCGPFSSHFGKLLAMMELSGIIAHCDIVLSLEHSRKQ